MTAECLLGSGRNNGEKFNVLEHFSIIFISIEPLFLPQPTKHYIVINLRAVFFLHVAK